MAKATESQLGELDSLRDFVIEVINQWKIWSEEELTKLTTINFGVLRKSATQRHGVTRWRQNSENQRCRRK